MKDQKESKSELNEIKTEVKPEEKPKEADNKPIETKSEDKPKDVKPSESFSEEIIGTRMEDIEIVETIGSGTNT